jgi:hypothetical protein
MDEQPRLTDLIPRHLLVFLFLVLLGLAVIAGLEALYWWMPTLASSARGGRLQALDLADKGTLAVWFSSTMLTLASLVAILVYTVRRHRSDDYHGHYRVWLWAALCCTLMSIAETARLHEGFQDMMIRLTGTRVFGDGSIWWLAPCFFLLGAVGIRLLLDMRECPLSCVALLTTVACYGVIVAAQFHSVPFDGAREIMFEAGAKMLGNLMLLAAMGLHARHVILDAEGLITARPKAAKRAARSAADADDDEPGQKESEDDEPVAKPAAATSSRPLTIHPPHGIASPAFPLVSARPIASGPVSASADEEEDEADDDAELQQQAGVTRKLTKAEKKALRRRLQKMRQQHDRRAG